MKVLVINTVEFKLNGISSVIMNYYKNMDKSDMKIDFVAINNIEKEYSKEFKENKSEVYILRRNDNPLKYFINLYKLMKSKQYDIVHIHGNSATVSIETVAAYFSKIPVRIVHSHNTTCSHKVLHKILYIIMKKTYTNGFACGEDAGKWLFRDDDFEIIKNGIDLSKFRYDNKISEEYKEKINFRDKIVIGHVGNFVYQKNHNFLINVFNKLQELDEDVRLLLIGDGPLLSKMKEKVDNLNIGDKICFLGKSNEVNKYLQAIDLFLLPSHHEGLPVVLIEAQALGLQCLASDRVSKEANITGLVDFLAIDDVNIWLKDILRFEKNSKNIESFSHDKIKTEGYDIYENAKKMKVLYEKYLMERRIN